MELDVIITIIIIIFNVKGPRLKLVKESVGNCSSLVLEKKMKIFLTHSKLIVYHYIMLLQLLYSNLAKSQFQYPYNGTIMYIFYICAEDYLSHLSEIVPHEGTAQ